MAWALPRLENADTHSRLEAVPGIVEKVKLENLSFTFMLYAGKLLHPAAGSLHVEKFLNLEKLYLKPPESAYWAVNGKAVQTLQPLVRLKELVLVP